MSQVNGSDSESNIICFEDGRPPLSIKDYQNIYHQITSRTENIEKLYSENYTLSFGDVEHLHHKIKQVIDIHHVVAMTESITVFFLKDRKEQYSSFERFSLYNPNLVSPVVNILLEYNISLVVPCTCKPQTYKITVNIGSRVGLLKKLEEDDPDMPWFIRSRIFGPTIKAHIDYVDYVVARTFLDGIDEWVSGCKKNIISNYIKIFKKCSDIVPEIFENSMALVIIIVAFMNSNRIVSQNVISQDTVRYCLMFVASFFIFCPLAMRFGITIERLIDSYQPLSYLSLNKGDENLIKEFEKAQKKTLWYVIINVVATVLLGIISSRIAASW